MQGMKSATSGENTAGTHS